MVEAEALETLVVEVVVRLLGFEGVSVIAG